MAEPKKLKSGHWRIRICYTDEKGKQIRKSFTAESKSEARHLADQFMTERKHNKKIVNKTLRQLVLHCNLRVFYYVKYTLYLLYAFYNVKGFV